jgi:hypothetical protein
MSKTQAASHPYNEPPTGWVVIARDGWPPRSIDTPEPQQQPVRVGNVMVPGRFRLDVRPDKQVAGPGVFIKICYRTEGNGVVLSRVDANGIDVPQALDILRKARPMEWWKRHVFMQMVFQLAREEIGGPPGSPAGDDAWHTAVGETLRDGFNVPISPRRNRLTPEHLAKVAEVYRQAWEDGEPPTKAVAQNFSVSHSTAARWVGAARKAKHLGDADGSRGGELPAAKRSTKEAKS